MISRPYPSWLVGAELFPIEESFRDRWSGKLSKQYDVGVRESERGEFSFAEEPGEPHHIGSGGTGHEIRGLQRLAWLLHEGPRRSSRKKRRGSGLSWTGDAPRHRTATIPPQVRTLIATRKQESGHPMCSMFTPFQAEFAQSEICLLKPGMRPEYGII